MFYTEDDMIALDKIISKLRIELRKKNTKIEELEYHIKDLKVGLE